MFYQAAYAVDVVAYLVFAGTEHGPLDFYYVLKAIDNSINTHNVTICNTERAHIELLDIIDRHITAILTFYTYGFCIGITREAPCIF